MSKVPALGKTSLQIFEKPRLWWVLRSLEAAGISKVVVCTTNREQAAFARRVRADLKRHGCAFGEFDVFKDQGLGVQGLPFHVLNAGMLDDTFVMEFGHNIQRVSHYQQLMLARERHAEDNQPDAVAYSVFPTRGTSVTEAASLRRSTDGNQALHWFHSFPIAANSRHAKRIAALDFDERRILETLRREGDLVSVAGDLLPEVDTAEEYALAKAQEAAIVPGLVVPLLGDLTTRVRWNLPNPFGAQIGVEFGRTI